MLDNRRDSEQIALARRDESSVNQTHKGPLIASRGRGGMAPGIEPRRRLWKPGEVNGLGEVQIRRGFAKVRASRRLRPDPPIPIARAVEVCGENPLLVPMALELPGGDCLAELFRP